MIVAVLVGVAILVLGQLVVRMWIEPVHELKKTLGRAAHAMTLYNSVQGVWITNEGDEYHEDKAELDKASQALRTIASDLRAHQRAIPFLRITTALFRLPTEEDVKRASSAIISWSTAVYGYGHCICDYQQTIDKHLHLGINWYSDWTVPMKSQVKQQKAARWPRAVA